MTTDKETLVKEWIEQARELGHQHARGEFTDDQPADIIDLEAWGDGMSYGEVAEIQGQLEEAYSEAKRNHVWEMLENPPKHCEAVADLYHWSTNYDAGKGPMSLFLDLVGFSYDEFGTNIYQGDEGYAGLGYVELGKLGRALNEYADAPTDVMEWVRELIAAEAAE